MFVHCYRMTLQKSVPGEKNVETVNNEWPSVEDRISETHNVYTMSEFICIKCRNSLQQKKPKIPDQACANGLKLHDIPQELDSITPLECRLVAKCIPFLTILLMKRKTLQSQWTMCKCTNTIGSGTKKFTSNAQ